MVTGRLLRWGNSYGIRLTKADVEGLGLPPGADLTVHLEGRPGKIDISHLPVFVGDPDAGADHDRILADEQLRKQGT